MAKRLFTLTTLNCAPSHHTRNLIHKTSVAHVKRTYFDHGALRLTTFLEATERAENRFGAIADSFKQRFSEVLDDPNNAILHEDFLAFTYLAKKEDVPALLRACKDLQKQQARDTELLGDSSRVLTIDPIILRKLHVLNMADEATQYFEDNLLKAGSWYPLMIVMDLLYENEKYEQCLNLAVAYTDNNPDMMHNLYKLAASAAFKMGTPDALRTLAKIFDHMKKGVDLRIAKGDHNENDRMVKLWEHDSKHIKRVIAAMCIQQGHYSTAVSVLHEKTAEEAYDIYNLNLVIQALLKMGRTSQAVSKLQTLIDMHKEDFAKYKRGEHTNLRRYHLKQDTYQMLLELLENGSMSEMDQKRMEYIKRISVYFLGTRTTVEGVLYSLLPMSVRQQNLDQTRDDRDMQQIINFDTKSEAPQQTSDSAEPQASGSEEPQVSGGEEPQVSGGEEPQVSGGDEPQVSSGEEPQVSGGEEPQASGGEEQEERAESNDESVKIQTNSGSV